MLLLLLMMMMMICRATCIGSESEIVFLFFLFTPRNERRAAISPHDHNKCLLIDRLHVVRMYEPVNESKR